MIFIILLVFITILTVLYNLTRSDDSNGTSGNEDPQFNPFNNPFIRVGGRFLKNPMKDSNIPNDPPK